MNKINHKKIQVLIDDGYITRRKHPTEDLYIYNYTHKALFDNKWNKETMMCRGLITDGKGNIVQRPFEKFFNWEQHNEDSKLPDLPVNEPYIIQEKMDGYLGILYWEGDKPAISTRGSFISDYAKVGTDMLRKKYKDVKFERKYTYLFEIIYPEGKIVVDYGEERALVLLAVIETKTNKQYAPCDFEFSNVKNTARLQLPFAKELKSIGKSNTLKGQIKEIQDRNLDNEEGYVFWFLESNFRIKIKFKDYCRVHRLLLGANQRNIWEMVRDKGSLSQDILDRMPEKFVKWAKDLERRFKQEADMLRVSAHATYNWARRKAPDSRKVFAQYIKDSGNLKCLVWCLYDDKYDQLEEFIWKQIKPKYALPFLEDSLEVAEKLVIK